MKIKHINFVLETAIFIMAGVLSIVLLYGIFTGKAFKCPVEPKHYYIEKNELSINKFVNKTNDDSDLLILQSPALTPLR
jgi:hypothetical protein